VARGPVRTFAVDPSLTCPSSLFFPLLWVTYRRATSLAAIPPPPDSHTRTHRALLAVAASQGVPSSTTPGCLCAATCSVLLSVQCACFRFCPLPPPSFPSHRTCQGMEVLVPLADFVNHADSAAGGDAMALLSDGAAPPTFTAIGYYAASRGYAKVRTGVPRQVRTGHSGHGAREVVWQAERWRAALRVCPWFAQGEEIAVDYLSQGFTRAQTGTNDGCNSRMFQSYVPAVAAGAAVCAAVYLARSIRRFHPPPLPLSSPLPPPASLPPLRHHHKLSWPDAYAVPVPVSTPVFVPMLACPTPSDGASPWTATFTTATSCMCR
jgi:hypothetical protein